MGWKTRLALLLLRVSAALPLALSHSLGAGAGGLLGLLPNRQRRVVAINLDLCFPELPAAERRRLLRRSLRESGKAMFELGALWRWPGARVLDLIRAVEGEREWRAALANGHGAIAITPHLGAWEVAGLYVSSRYPMTTLFRPNRLGPMLDAAIRAGRERLGARTVPTDAGGVRALYRALRAGEVLGILPDQDPGAEGGIFAPFFGQPVQSMVLLSRLAHKQQAPVFLVYAERLARGRGYRLRFEALPAVVMEESLEQSVAAVNAAVEHAVRRLPEQYLWAYKRFKTRPPGMPKVY